MRRWEHQVSADWLRARKRVLSATDIKKLVPAFKRTVKNKPGADEIVPEFAAVWCDKTTDTGDIEIGSPSYAAARGHIMEPYAVDSWNQQCSGQMNHWDDCVITNGVIGFSPDALDAEQPEGVVSIDHKEIHPKAGLEIKSYDPSHHMQCCLKGKMKHDEIMQIAVAFAVCSGLEEMALVFFCPDAPISMHAEIYTRQDLSAQISMVLGIAAEYERNAKLLESIQPKLHACFTEQEIWDEYVEENYNPVSVLSKAFGM